MLQCEVIQRCIGGNYAGKKGTNITELERWMCLLDPLPFLCRSGSETGLEQEESLIDCHLQPIARMVLKV